MRTGLDSCVAVDRTAIAQRRTEELVIEHQTKLARYLRRMVGDAEVALDLTQDVFLSAYRMLAADPARELRAGLALSRRYQRRDLVHAPPKDLARASLDRDVDRGAPGASTSEARPRSTCRRHWRGCRRSNRRRC